MSSTEQPRNEKSKMANLLQKVKGGKNNATANGQQSQANDRNWIHPPERLVNRHVAYLVKFLGTTQVDQPKGIEVVKDAVRRLQFNQQLRKAEARNEGKCKKVEITISVDGVAIQEPRTNNILHQFPLHKISYCADDKGAKKYFSFIAKGPSVGGNETHECFVFISTKLASEITLTIGQAFDLAYRRFLTDTGKYLEMQKLSLQVKKLDLQMNAYKNRLQDLSKIIYRDDLNSYLKKNKLQEITEFKCPDLDSQIASYNDTSTVNGTNASDSGLDINSSNDNSSSGMDTNLLLETPPPQHNGRPLPQLPNDRNPCIGTKLEGLLLDSDSDSDFDPRACESAPPASSLRTAPPPALAPPPKSSRRSSQTQQQSNQQLNPLAQINDPFGASPFTTAYQPQVNSQPINLNGPSMGVNGQSLLNGQSMSFNNHLSSHNSFVNGFGATHGTVPMQPNYNITDLELPTSVFNTTNASNGGYDPFDTQKINTSCTIFNNNNGSFGSEKQTVALDSSFNGFLDKRISEMKDGFSRGISFGNDDFSTPYDVFKKN